MTTTSSSSFASAPPAYVDIGANLLDDRFTRGTYHGKNRHEPDFDAVLSRAENAGVKHLVLTAGTLRESKEAVETVRRLRQANASISLYCTVGVHPTRCNEFNDSGDPNKHLQELIAAALDGEKDGVVCAVGEMGLDYDRLQFCPKQTQLDYFKLQLRLAQSTQLPMFLHNRNVNDDLYNLLKDNQDMWRTSGGVVHTFDDSAELAAKFMDLGLFIGLNGCSLKTEENLSVVKTLPLDRILLETDCPYCEIRKTHAGYSHIKTYLEAKPEKKFLQGFAVKGRNEPANIVQVAEVVAGVKGIPVQDVAQACYENSLKLYGWKE
jgi:TatD DNase family protein